MNVIAALAVMSLAVVGTTLPGGDCSGCVGSLGSSYNNSSCVTVTWHSPQAVEQGECSQATCTELFPCEMHGSVTIAHSGVGGCDDIYVRTRVDGSCVGGITTLKDNEDTDLTYRDDLSCGSTLQVVVYTVYDSAKNCAASGAAGFAWTCTACSTSH